MTLSQVYEVYSRHLILTLEFEVALFLVDFSQTFFHLEDVGKGF